MSTPIRTRRIRRPSTSKRMARRMIMSRRSPKRELKRRRTRSRKKISSVGMASLSRTSSIKSRSSARFASSSLAADQVRLTIAQIAVMMLRDEAGVQFDPQLDVVDALCIDCVASALRGASAPFFWKGMRSNTRTERDYVKDHADAVKRYKGTSCFSSFSAHLDDRTAAAKGSHNSGVWISRAWLEGACSIPSDT